MLAFVPGKPLLGDQERVKAVAVLALRPFDPLKDHELLAAAEGAADVIVEDHPAILGQRLPDRAGLDCRGRADVDLVVVRIVDDPGFGVLDRVALPLVRGLREFVDFLQVEIPDGLVGGRSGGASPADPEGAAVEFDLAGRKVVLVAGLQCPQPRRFVDPRVDPLFAVVLTGSLVGIDGQNRPGGHVHCIHMATVDGGRFAGLRRGTDDDHPHRRKEGGIDLPRDVRRDLQPHKRPGQRPLGNIPVPLHPLRRRDLPPAPVHLLFGY